jgi:hypothetical protein
LNIKILKMHGKKSNGKSNGKAKQSNTHSKENKSETQTRRKLSWGEAIWGPTDGPTDKVSYRGAKNRKQLSNIPIQNCSYLLTVTSYESDWAQIQDL